MPTDTTLSAILALMVAARDGDADRPTERILADAGLTGDEIAKLTGRDPARLEQPPAAAFGQMSDPRAAAVTSRA